jgi:hypothetical protein
VALDGLQWLLESKWLTGLVLECVWSDWGCVGVALDQATVAAGVKTVRWIGVGVPLEWPGVCWSSTGWAPGVKTIHWIGVGVLLE